MSKPTLFTVPGRRPLCALWLLFLLGGSGPGALGILKAEDAASESEPPELAAAPVAVLQVRATAYTHTEPDHLPYGKKSALGTELRFTKEYHSAAADWSFFPLGTVFRIRGYDRLFVVDDYGSALVGKPTVDIYFDTMAGMKRWGARQVWIEVVRFGSFHESRKILAARANHAHCRAMLARMTQDDWFQAFSD